MSTIWVDKYKPKGTAELLGQTKNVVRIKQWLKTFDASRSKPLFIHGPPGIGKTTAAHLCCKEAGYLTVEFNASDQRNKNIIKDIISTVASTSRLNFFGRASETKDAIILDEVDGMAGNEDRGGIGQLLIELKHTKKPMIFICNDGQHQKLRSLKDKCEIIEFKRPDYDVIRALVKKIAKDEGLLADKIDIKNLADSSDFDIRQIVNSLSLFKDSDSASVAKTTRLNAFEATKKVLTADQQKIDSRFECFFADYNIMPLFMFENYIKSKPVKGDQLKAISRAADSFCLSDLADKEIRSKQNWSLLQAQALLSTVIPSKMMQSYSLGRIDFPQFLGKLSNINKRIRLTQELNAHMCLTVRGGLDADYLETFSERISGPLIGKEKLGGVDAVVDFMHDYDLIREDVNSIMELAAWSFKPDPMQRVDAKTKTALTNTLKKRSVALPYFVDDNKPTKKRKPVGFGDEEVDEEEDEEEEEVQIKPKAKRVIKNDKPPSAAAAKKANAKTTKNAVTKSNSPPHENEKTDKAPPAAKNNTNSKSTVQAKKATAVAPQVKSDEPLPDKRPPPPASNGIARFFTAAKKQKS